MRADEPFIELMTQMRGGAVAQICSEKLQEVLDGIAEFGGSGEVTIKLKLKKNKYGQLEVNGDVKAKKPEKLMRRRSTGFPTTTRLSRGTRTRQTLRTFQASAGFWRANNPGTQHSIERTCND